MSEETENEQAESPAEEDPWAEAMAEQSDAEAEQAAAIDPGAAGSVTQLEQPESAELEQLSRGTELALGSDVNMDVILDVPLTISMEIGRTKITIRNLLKLIKVRWSSWIEWPVSISM